MMRMREEERRGIVSTMGMCVWVCVGVVEDEVDKDEGVVVVVATSHSNDLWFALIDLKDSSMFDDDC